MMRLIVALALIHAVAACSSFGRADLANRAQTELVGLSTEQLLACAGAPDRRAMSGETEVLTYGVRTQTQASKDHPGSTRFCEATFVIRDGRVSKVSYRGKTGGWLTSGEQCGYVVQNCVQ